MVVMRIVRGSAAVLALVLTGVGPVHTQTRAETPLPKFYPDDPLWREPEPVPTLDAQARQLSDMLERVNSTFSTPGELHPANGIIPARGVNTIDEVIDGPWFVNRHGSRRMSRDELIRGPGNDRPPLLTRPLQVLVVKPAGLRPGLLVADARGSSYLLRFDPPGYEELATGAEMIASRILYALGYHIAENYVVRFERRQIAASETGLAMSTAGRTRTLTEADIDRFLRTVADGPGSTYRAVATRLPDDRSRVLGPYQVHGVRSDDPNDIVPHEQRRDLRGLFVFCAWLNFNNMRAVNTADVLVDDEGIPYIRHYLFDFTETLGSSVLGGPKRAWEGQERLYPGIPAIAANVAGLGVYTHWWMRANYLKLRGVGHFDYETFDPERWTTNYLIAPFVNRLPDDTFWAAKLVMAFTDDDIQALVSTGQFSDPEAAAWLVRCLVERRNRIGRAYLGGVLPLDHFRVESGRLVFDDLEARYGLTTARTFTTEWFSLDNGTGQLTPLARSSSFSVPPAGSDDSYIAARISGVAAGKTTTVYLRSKGGSLAVVGVEREWPGKVVARPKGPARRGASRYRDLHAKQKALFDQFTTEYDNRTSRTYTAREFFDSLSLSEQTTFDAVTHALLQSSLTDKTGNGLGSPIDLLQGIDRIAGQNAGRGSDQQFRLYVRLTPEARDVLEKSREFFRDHENTAYHVGYPHSYRQTGKEPNVQFSLSEDGRRADIDVDYRSSRSPKALFNGHLTAANSDVRVGKNPRLHDARWHGFVARWQDFFGRLDDVSEPSRDLLYANRPPVPTPLPPDRSLGAAPDSIEDAVQEFLTDWLVRRQYDQALEVLSPQAYACLNVDDDASSESLVADGARARLRELMEYSAHELGNRASLSDAIVAAEPRDPSRTIAPHPFSREFMLTPLVDREARQYLCGQQVTPAAQPDYHEAVFTFRVVNGGALGLLWNREEGRWRLVSYRVMTQ
jgi:hypothetical protein